MITIESLFAAMPKELRRKISGHELKQTVAALKAATESGGKTADQWRIKELEEALRGIAWAAGSQGDKCALAECLKGIEMRANAALGLDSANAEVSDRPS